MQVVVVGNEPLGVDRNGVSEAVGREDEGVRARDRLRAGN